MKSRIIKFIEKMCEEQHVGAPHCDISSSRIQLVNAPIPNEVYRELESISVKYNRDINCLAGDFLTLALKDAIENIPKEEKEHLDEVRHEQDVEEAERIKKQSEFTAGGT